MEELEKHAENLQILIQKAAEKTIPKRKASSRSKPWWNDHISEQRKIIIIILPIEKHMQSKTMVLYPPCH